MLELKNISFAVDNRQILQEVNLQLPDSRFVVITGPNGSGKTTLARLIMGINSPPAAKSSSTGRI